MFREALGKQLIIADGGMGTELQRAGLELGEAPMLWNITHPEQVKGIHTAYLEAGAGYVTANTFGASALGLKDTPYSMEEVVHAGMRLAREAVDEFCNRTFATEYVSSAYAEAHSDKAYAALDISPLGELLEPMGQVSFDEALRLFKEQIAVGVSAGADFICIETMIDLVELKAAVLAAKETCSLPIVATVSINEQGCLYLTGEGLDGVAALLDSLGVEGLGINCGSGPKQMEPFIRQLSTLTSTPLVFCPNAGLPTLEDGKAVYHLSPEEFAAQMKPLAEGCLAVAGGCCGTTPAHIKALTEAVGDTMQSGQNR